MQACVRGCACACEDARLNVCVCAQQTLSHQHDLPARLLLLRVEHQLQPGDTSDVVPVALIAARRAQRPLQVNAGTVRIIMLHAGAQTTKIQH